MTRVSQRLVCCCLCVIGTVCLCVSVCLLDSHSVCLSVFVSLSVFWTITLSACLSVFECMSLCWTVTLSVLYLLIFICDFLLGAHNIKHVTKLLTSSALWCTTFKLESLHVIWLILCRLPRLEWCALACAVSLRRPTTSQLGCILSSASRPSLSVAQHHGTLSLLIYTVSDTSDFKNQLKTYLFNLSFDI